MRQSEYLRELKECLETRVTPEELTDILSDYESFFISGREEGRTEDEISEELGSPAFLAKSLLEEYGENQSEQPVQCISSPGRRLCAYALDAVIAVIPALILSLVIGTIALPYLLFITYPSPAAGASAYLGYSAYESYSTYEVTSNSEIEGNGGRAFSQEIWKDGRKPGLSISISAVFGLLFYLFYSLGCTLLLRGQTIGKKFLHIKVKHSNTEPATRGAILCREFIGKLILNSIPIVPLISFFTILFTKEHRALHDMLAGTIVIDV